MCIINDIQKQLKDHLLNGNDWEKMETHIEGVYVVRVPPTRNRDALLYLEFNPLDENKRNIKKRGLYLSTREELVSFAEKIQEDGVYQIITAIEQINPTTKKLKKLIAEDEN